MIGIEIVRQILASDIINWLLAFIGGIFVYRIVDNMQTKIARHSIIKDIETTINDLFSKQIAKSNRGKKNEDIVTVNLRTILHDFSPWQVYSRDSEIIIEDNQRYIRIRDDENYTEYVSTQALHEALIIFRRIEKLYKDSILKPVDLVDMWREILPFGSSRRLEFLTSYFSKFDVEPVIFVLYNTLLACYKFRMKNAVDYFRKYYKSNPELASHFLDNGRYRIQEKLKIKLFKRITG
ncbi:MAG TPA: hypothetical protein VEG39_00545 [Clostridia bacterium]|nr:hypothetical protein [Clostridia bacterium]